MSLGQLRISRRSIGIVAAFAGTVSLAIGAHAALSMRALDAAQGGLRPEQATESVRKGSRIALVIGNGHYPMPPNHCCSRSMMRAP